MELKDLVGGHVLTGCQYGTIAKENDWEYSDSSTVDFILDGKNISAIENSEDGYRSCMDELKENREGLEITNTFKPVKVLGIIRDNDSYQNNDVVDLIDCITGKIVISVGTTNTNDYYPCFEGVFNPENMCLNKDK